METLTINQNIVNADLIFSYFIKMPDIEKETFIEKVLSYSGGFEKTKLEKVLNQFNSIEPNTKANISMEEIVDIVKKVRKY